MLLGSPPAAVMQGVPGTSGDRLIAVGDSVSGYVLVRVDARLALLVRDADSLRLELKEVR